MQRVILSDRKEDKGVIVCDREESKCKEQSSETEREEVQGVIFSDRGKKGYKQGAVFRDGEQGH